MSLTIIELNDSDIRTAHDAEIISRDPGYAVIKPGRIETGIDAWSVARIKPRETSNKYWSQLNQDPLIISSPLARHNADLAYNQLITIYEHAGKPDEILFSVPGSFNRDQLATLLGIVEACPFTAIGIVDTAIASTAAVAETGQYNHLDIFLHYAIVSTIDVTDQVSRKSVRVIDNVGIAEIYDTCAEYFSDLLIDQSRFDPLHHAETEQTLYNQIPGCLSTLSTTDETNLEIEFKDKRYQAKVSTAALVEKLRIHYEKIYKEINDTTINLISDRLHILPGFSIQLQNSILIDETSVFRGCNLNIDKIRSNGVALSFITSLPATNTPTKPTEMRKPLIEKLVQEINIAKPPSHILIDNKAYVINGNPAYLSENGNIKNFKNDETQLSIVIKNGNAHIRAENDIKIFINNKMTLDGHINIGDTIKIENSKLTVKCIEVI